MCLPIKSLEQGGLYGRLGSVAQIEPSQPQGRSLLPDARIVEHEIKAKSVAVEGLGDVGLAIGSQQVEREMAQPCKDAGIAADAAGILGQGSVKDVMEPVFDGPVAADGLGQLFGAGLAGAQIQGRLLGAGDEGLAGGVEDLGGARDLDQALEVIVPGLQAAAGGQGPHAHAALLDAVAPAQGGAVVLVMGRAAPDLLAQARQQPGLIALERDQCVAAEPDDPLDRVFCKCSASSVYRQSLSPSSAIRRWAAAIS